MISLSCKLFLKKHILTSLAADSLFIILYLIQYAFLRQGNAIGRRLSKIKPKINKIFKNNKLKKLILSNNRLETILTNIRISWNGKIADCLLPLLFIFLYYLG